jgi:hypothetical protein
MFADNISTHIVFDYCIQKFRKNNEFFDKTYKTAWLFTKWHNIIVRNYFVKFLGSREIFLLTFVFFCVNSEFVLVAIYFFAVVFCGNISQLFQ